MPAQMLPAVPALELTGPTPAKLSLKNAPCRLPPGYQNGDLRPERQGSPPAALGDFFPKPKG